VARIIIVDDDSALREAVRRLMEGQVNYVMHKPIDCLGFNEKGYGWYNKFNKVNKRDKFKS